MKRFIFRYSMFLFSLLFLVLVFVLGNIIDFNSVLGFLWKLQIIISRWLAMLGILPSLVGVGISLFGVKRLLDKNNDDASRKIFRQIIYWGIFAAALGWLLFEVASFFTIPAACLGCDPVPPFYADLVWWKNYSTVVDAPAIMGQ